MSRPDLSDSQRRVVLVADDNDAMLDLAARVIERLGLVPLRASDGAAALEFASRCTALLVCAILDIQMPILDGVEAAHAIQRIAPDLPIVLMSGAVPISLADRIEHLRTLAILHKPFPLSALSEVLVRAVRESSTAHAGMEAIATNGKEEQCEYL